MAAPPHCSRCRGASGMEEGFKTCSGCRGWRTKRKALDEVASALDPSRAARIGSDFAALKPEDFDTSVGNDGRVDPKAAQEKRQEYSRAMGELADSVRGGDLHKNLGSYVAGLAEQERRFANRRLARSVSIAAAHAELSRELLKQVAKEFFADRIAPTGYALRPQNRHLSRTAVLLLSDLHFGANMDARGNPIPYRATEEARRFEYVVRSTLDFKPQYREQTRLVVLLNGDVIDGYLKHDERAGLPLAEQKAAFWSYLRAAIGLFAQQFPSVHVECQPGNHGRNVARHPGRATEDKWDGVEWDMYFALSQMASALPNVTWSIPFQAVSVVDLHGSKLLLTHGDTEVKLGHPDLKAAANGASLDRINATQLYGCRFDVVAFGHFHTPRYQPRSPRTIYNGALVPPNGHARTNGYVGEPCGQFLWEAVEGHPVGDLRFLEVGPAQDADERLGTLIRPFRFPV